MTNSVTHRYAVLSCEEIITERGPTGRKYVIGRDKEIKVRVSEDAILLLKTGDYKFADAETTPRNECMQCGEKQRFPKCRNIQLVDIKKNIRFESSDRCDDDMYHLDQLMSL